VVKRGRTRVKSRSRLGIVYISLLGFPRFVGFEGRRNCAWGEEEIKRVEQVDMGGEVGGDLIWKGSNGSRTGLWHL